MGYALEAVIGPVAVIRTAIGGLPDGTPGAVAVPLEQGLALVPMTNPLFDALTDGTSKRPPWFADMSSGIDRLLADMPGGFDRLLAEWSAAGPLAYVEAEYFGGVGCQAAVVWEGGTVVLGPVHLGETESFPPGGSPISRALARLGAWRGKHWDEFDAVGLWRHRSTEGWMGEVGRGRR